MGDFIHAVQDARETIHRRSYEPTNCIVFAHPKPVEDARSEMDWSQPFGDGGKAFGMTIETTTGLPKNVVVLVHKNAAMYGPDAIAFATVED